jgi:hypothetical protein
MVQFVERASDDRNYWKVIIDYKGKLECYGTIEKGIENRFDFLARAMDDEGYENTLSVAHLREIADKCDELNRADKCDELNRIVKIPSDPPPGLYLVEWLSGGSSYAVIAMNERERIIRPVNWISDGLYASVRKDIKSLDKIR